MMSLTETQGNNTNQGGNTMRLLTGFFFSSIAVALSSALPATAATARAPSEVSGLAYVIDGDTTHLTVPGTEKPVKVPAASHCPNQGVSK
jgi:endonuclease YncB( thermonuclease family)